MKTSNKLMLAAMLFVLISLCSYDYLLRAEYVSGKYKDPYNGFATLKFKDFDRVDVNSSTAANVKFVQGPFSIRIDTNTLEYVKVKQQGSTLQINASFESNYRFNPHPYILVISCPRLNEVIVSAAYMADHKQVIDTVVNEGWNMRQVLIDGFKQDSLKISQDYGSTVVLANNNIHSVNAVIGKSQGSGSKIIIKKGNNFQEATFDIRNKSTLLLNDAVIHTLNYNLADSARLVLSGAAQKALQKKL